jgi:hypothetical protein
MSPEPVFPRGNYQESLEHALTMAHILEDALQFFPQDCQLAHRTGTELLRFSGWLKTQFNWDETLLDARRHVRPQ